MPEYTCADCLNFEEAPLDQFSHCQPLSQAIQLAFRTDATARVNRNTTACQYLRPTCEALARNHERAHA